jgi:hypothetical protein
MAFRTNRDPFNDVHSSEVASGNSVIRNFKTISRKHNELKAKRKKLSTRLAGNILISHLLKTVAQTD